MHKTNSKVSPTTKQLIRALYIRALSFFFKLQVSYITHHFSVPSQFLFSTRSHKLRPHIAQLFVSRRSRKIICITEIKKNYLYHGDQEKPIFHISHHCSLPFLTRQRSEPNSASIAIYPAFPSSGRFYNNIFIVLP